MGKMRPRSASERKLECPIFEDQNLTMSVQSQGHTSSSGPHCERQVTARCKWRVLTRRVRPCLVYRQVIHDVTRRREDEQSIHSIAENFGVAGVGNVTEMNIRDALWI